MLKLVSALETPFDSVLDYYDSFNGDDRDIENNLIGFALYGKERYERNISFNSTYENNSLYYLIDDNNPNYIIGFGNIGDPDIDYELFIFNAGLLSYGVRPNERKKGYGTSLLSLLLEECKKLGFKKVSVSCFADNYGSKRIIEKNGGELDKGYFKDSRLALKYWINTEKEKKDVKVLCKTIPSKFKGIRKNH